MSKPFIRGRVRVTLFDPKKEDHERSIVNLKTRKPISLGEIGSSKNDFLDYVSTVCGVDNPSGDSVRHAVDVLFYFIVSLRSSGFIQGEFLEDPQIKGGLDKLDGRVANLERLFEELLQRLKIRDPH